MMIGLFRAIMVGGIVRSTAYMMPGWITLGVVLSLVGSPIRSGGKTRRRQTLGVVCLAWLGVGFALFAYQYRYDQGQHIPTGDRSGVVTVESSHNNRTQIVSHGDRSYRWRTDQLYPVGAQLRVIGSIQDESISLRPSNPQPQRKRIMQGEMDRPQWLRMRGIHGTLRTSSVIYQSDTPLQRHQSMRMRLIEQIRSSFDDIDHQALLAGMLIGDRSLFSQETYQGFIDSGLVHIIAVSGGNLMMIMVFLSLVLRRVPLKIRTIVMMLSIVAYVMIVGPDSSIIRAAIMGILLMVALLLGRLTQIWRLMAIAIMLMLWRNPYLWRHDIGFIFSFVALIGVVLTRTYSTSLRDKHKKSTRPVRMGSTIVAEYMIPTRGATVMIAPFLLLFTGSFNLLSLVANLLVLPIVPFVMIGGGVAVRGPKSFSIPIAYGLEYIVAVSQRVVNHGVALLVEQRGFVVVVMLIMMIYAYMTYHRTQK